MATNVTSFERVYEALRVVIHVGVTSALDARIPVIDRVVLVAGHTDHPTIFGLHIDGAVVVARSANRSMLFGHNDEYQLRSAVWGQWCHLPEVAAERNVMVLGDVLVAEERR